MKYLFVVQGEGRGHLTQAMTMEKMLNKHGHEVAGVLVGQSKSRKIPDFFANAVKAPISFFNTVNFVPASKGKHPSIIKTFLYNATLWFRFLPSIRIIRKQIKESGADVVVNFYEMLCTMAYMTSGKKIPMVVIGHQFLLLHKDLHIPQFGYEGHHALNIYSRAIAGSSSKILALSFRKMEDDNKRNIIVVPPLLRPDVLNFRHSDGVNSEEYRKGDYILGYIVNAGFAEEVITWHNQHKDIPLHFFWDNAEHGKEYKVDETLTFYYLDDKEFLRQMAGCYAYASTAGFESICEAMYLGKPLMMVPSHIEQKCNAYDATMYNAAVKSDIFDLSVLTDFAKNKFIPDEDFPEWARSAEKIFIKELTEF